ncbi:hypothetical protein [Chondromyces apiculatus]|uniref:PEGA domain-containing protein n=1 Tax=Chondromyces apiculatus DSM 436 TaxID=1192034 RepID=A0A017SVI4_9BACT|nr:hypothetical protein [Chondromyces apiculatus]EYF00782.1 Hypothetical protein CAP_9001 [Chondromyces apiculatus DSM 436]
MRVAALAACTVLAVAPPVHADVVEACVEASEEAQARRDRGELQAARALLLTCASADCPAIVQRDCTSWLEDVDARQPSIVPRVRDAAGHDRADVRLLIDGKEVAASLDGRALPVDPGPRRLRVEAEGAAPVEQTLQIRERERGRVVDVVLADLPSKTRPPPPPQPAPRESTGLHIPVASWVLGGVAVAGGAAFTVLGVRAQGEVDKMRSTCAPRCAPDRVDAASREALVANIALGAGVAALGAAVVVVLVSQPREAPPAARRSGPELRLGLGGPAGTGLVLGGRF